MIEEMFETETETHRVARAGDGEGVVETVSWGGGWLAVRLIYSNKNILPRSHLLTAALTYEGAVSGFAGHRGGGGAAGEGRGELQGGEVQSDLVDQRVALADRVDAGGGRQVRGEVRAGGGK